MQLKWKVDTKPGKVIQSGANCFAFKLYGGTEKIQVRQNEPQSKAATGAPANATAAVAAAAASGTLMVIYSSTVTGPVAWSRPYTSIFLGLVFFVRSFLCFIHPSVVSLAI